jgi:hypothetical protein
MAARKAAAISHAKHPDGSRTRPLHIGLEAKFIREAREVHPEADEATVAKVAKSLRVAYYAELSRSATAARARKQAAKP